jgi:hypothetical protein
MNAVVADVENERRLPGRERSWIDAAFADWGVWLWEHRHFEGYPTADNVQAFMQGRGGGIAGHRVLCRDMPPWILFAHVIWWWLPDHEALVVWAEFVPSVEENGHTWTQLEKAEKLGISHDAYRCRLSSARMQIWKWSKDKRDWPGWGWSRRGRN